MWPCELFWFLAGPHRLRTWWKLTQISSWFYYTFSHRKLHLTQISHKKDFGLCLETLLWRVVHSKMAPKLFWTTMIFMCVCVSAVHCVIYSRVLGWGWTWPSTRMWLTFHSGQKQLSQHQHSTQAYGSVLAERNLPPAYVCVCGHRGLIGDDRCGWIIEERPASPTSICTYVRFLSLFLHLPLMHTNKQTGNCQELPPGLSHVTVP